MRKASVIGALVLLVALGPVASAGEVKGPPGPGGAEGGTTPIDGFFLGEGAASICSFSGLNDEVSEEEPTQTQSFGTFMTLIMKILGIDPHAAMDILGEHPGQACNPTKAPWGNPKG